jgi:hypothetical protein
MTEHSSFLLDLVTVKNLFGIVLFAASKIVFVIVLVMISMFIVSKDSIPVNNRNEISVRFIAPFRSIPPLQVDTRR